MKTGDRIHHTKFGKGTVAGPFSDNRNNKGKVVCWGVLFDDETFVNEHLKAINQPLLFGEPFPVVPGLEPEAIKVI